MTTIKKNLVAINLSTIVCLIIMGICHLCNTQLDMEYGFGIFVQSVMIITVFAWIFAVIKYGDEILFEIIDRLPKHLDKTP